MTKEEAIKEINETQDFYVDELIKIIKHVNKKYDNLKEIDFTSPTGTGKTVMMSKLINKMPDYFFFITTLSRGQLRIQIENNIKQRINQENAIVFGLNDYTKNTKLQLADFKRMIEGKKNLVWIRDEGHIATNRWQEVLRENAVSIINFSATNKSNNGIQCNFTHTMMLRTVTQQIGTVEEALKQLLLVKKTHEKVSNYNPCALLRIMNDNFAQEALLICEKLGLKAINITEENFDMSSLCDDANEYDVIINKFKITEGIDLKRCHVVYMDNKPGNEATIVQVIGRSRRNALLWRNDIDILNPKNKKLLEDTRKSFIFYNVEEARVNQNDNGELAFTLCDVISIENLKSDIDIYVDNGKLANGLKIIELENKTGKFHVKKDEKYGYNVVDNDDFYKNIEVEYSPFVINLTNYNYNIKKIYLKNNISDFFVHKFKRSSTFDRRKYILYIYEAYCLENKLNVDFEFWKNKLGIYDDYHSVTLEEWREFKKFISQGIDSNEIDVFYESFPYDKRWNLRGKCYVKPIEVYDRKNIFKNSFTTTWIRSDLIPYIEKIEIVNTSIKDKIDKLLFENKVTPFGRNKFAISNHPLTNELKDKGINSLIGLKRKVNSAKGNTILGTSTKVLKDLINNVENFEDIDTYNVSFYNLESLNKIFRWSLKKSDIEAYITRLFPIKEIIPKKNSYIEVLRFDKKEDNYISLSSQNFYIYKADFENPFVSYKKIINDKEIAILGTDTMRYQDHVYVEDRNVTSKINKYCKFNDFISKKYKNIIDINKKFSFKHDNFLGLDKKCNSCLGFCVEYYAKIKLYGENYFKKYIDHALKESKQSEITDEIYVRASMLAYRDSMALCFGPYMNVLIPSISVEQLVMHKYAKFVQLVKFYGDKTYEFVKNKLKISKESFQMFDPDLSVNHIGALCDFISEDTIIDLKCTNSLNEKYIKQVLAYYYLSTKRSDLKIKKLIVFDAISDKCIEIEL